MLEDRDYMRAPEHKPRRRMAVPVWGIILVVNIVVFCAEFANGPQSVRACFNYGALSLQGLKDGFVWQFLTFQFLHGGLPHLVMNLVALYFFARPVEEAVGKSAFLKLYLFSGIAGGLLQVLLGIWWPRFDGPLVGASAGLCGLIAAFALLSPDSTFYIGFVLPIPAKYCLPVMIAVSVLFVVIPIPIPFLNGVKVAHAAHLGGTLFGLFYIRHVIHWRWHWPWRKQPFRFNQPPRQLVSVRVQQTPAWGRPQINTDEGLPTAEFISKEVDPILDKISAHGIQSLTERERKILEAARKKMARR
jgi:membrane associated rhomboid family serine protease